MRRPKTIKESCSQALPLELCYAKTRLTQGGLFELGLTVTEHSQIVGKLAKQLIKRYPKWFQDEFFPPGTELIAAAHDVGKVCPTFQEKIRRATPDYTQNALPELKINPKLERNWDGHSGVSQVSVTDAGSLIPLIIGKHHGYTPQISHRNNHESLGGDAWQVQRENLIKFLKDSINVEWPNLSNAVKANVIAGLTTVADWIGSGFNFDYGLGQPETKLIEESLDRAGFVQPDYLSDLSFEQIFGWEPYEAQKTFYDQVDPHGVYVLEAPMGFGKTEAALYAAYKILTKNKATGIYFALPTQLTSNKIYERVEQFLDKVLTKSYQNGNALLVHGDSWLYESEMGEECLPGRAWFSNTKKSILAPFAIGTIDQALMSVMNVKHGFVRSLGLAGKVVILDEVHTYDSYTGTILANLITQLKELKATVLILSATLTNERLKDLLSLSPEQDFIQTYPLVSSLSEAQVFKQIEISQPQDFTFLIKLESQKEIAFDNALLLAQEGQQILWIENTVKQAQEVYKILGARGLGLGLEIGLVHSRFLKTDRNKNESDWVKKLSKNNQASRKKGGRILVGTQVLEQSLDIDADYLITQICPMDMLLQRMGRLWRHRENDSLRPKTAKRSVLVIAPDLDLAKRDPALAFGATAMVYAPYVLIRTLEVLAGLEVIVLAKDIRDLLESTYCEKADIELSRLKEKLLERRDSLSRLATISLAKGGKTLPDENVSTRFSDYKTCDVLLLRNRGKVDNGYKIKLNNDETLLIDKKLKVSNKKEWREIAKKIIANIVSVPIGQAPEIDAPASLDWLTDYLYLSSGDSMTRVGIIADDGIIRGQAGGEASKTHELGYDDAIGYWAKKK